MILSLFIFLLEYMWIKNTYRKNFNRAATSAVDMKLQFIAKAAPDGARLVQSIKGIKGRIEGAF